MRLLFVKQSLAFPRSSGHDVHCYHMMKALSEAGNEVSLATAESTTEQAKAGLDLSMDFHLDELCSDTPENEITLPWAQEKFRSYWGVDKKRIVATQTAAEICNADCVVVVGLEVLPYLAGVSKAKRIWYAADEWFWHHSSLVKFTNRKTWSSLRDGVIKGLYERAYGSIVDQAWVVSRADQRAMKLVAGIKNVPVIPNGVDTDFFQQVDAPKKDQTCVFWGRLDFEPNIQALDWFCQRVWPSIIEKRPDAEFRIFGFNASDQVKRLSRSPGISLAENLPDIRAEISKNRIVVLPFVSGGGIKNKLLEAASMSMPILCSSRTVNGIASPENAPLICVNTTSDWVKRILTLWDDPSEQERIGQSCRDWVMSNHSWESSANLATAALES